MIVEARATYNERMSLADLLRAASGEDARAADYEALASAIRGAPAEARELLDRESDATTTFCLLGSLRASDGWLAAIDAGLAAGSSCVADACFRIVKGVHAGECAAPVMQVLDRHGHRPRLADVVRRSIREFMDEERARDPFAHTDPWGNPTVTDDLIAYIVRGYIEKLPEPLREAAGEEARSYPEISDKL
jgi:hypothetical protein